MTKLLSEGGYANVFKVSVPARLDSFQEPPHARHTHSRRKHAIGNSSSRPDEHKVHSTGSAECSGLETELGGRWIWYTNRDEGIINVLLCLAYRRAVRDAVVLPWLRRNTVLVESAFQEESPPRTLCGLDCLCLDHRIETRVRDSSRCSLVQVVQQIRTLYSALRS